VRRAPPEFDDADPSAVRLFFDVLAPYGSWVYDARLGLVDLDDLMRTTVYGEVTVATDDAPPVPPPS
jgi:hypothetical protein